MWTPERFAGSMQTSSVTSSQPPRADQGHTGGMKRLLLALTLLAIGSPVLAADERIGTMPGSAAPRAWRNNTPEGFIKNDFCFEDVCSYDRIVSRKGEIVVTDTVSEKGEPRYEYIEIKKTTKLVYVGIDF